MSTINTLDLVRYDPARNCFVLKGTTMHTWPDGTPKSMNNAFNWREGKATAVPFVANKNHRALDLHSHGNIYTYTKATAPSNKFKGGVPPKGNKMYTIKKQ
jgi:hypothetical protein